MLHQQQQHVQALLASLPPLTATRQATTDPTGTPVQSNSTFPTSLEWQLHLLHDLEGHWPIGTASAAVHCGVDPTLLPELQHAVEEWEQKHMDLSHRY